MQTAIGIGGAASGRKRDWQDNVDFVVASEGLGADFVWSAEAWGMDALQGACTQQLAFARRIARLRK